MENGKRMIEEGKMDDGRRKTQNGQFCKVDSFAKWTIPHNVQFRKVSVFA